MAESRRWLTVNMQAIAGYANTWNWPIAVTRSGAQFDLGAAAELEGGITQVLRGE